MPRPIDIPDNAVFESARKIKLGPPTGMEDSVLTIDAMLVPENELGVPEWYMVWEMDDEDLASLVRHRKVFITFMSPHMIPHRVTFPAKDQEDAYWSLFFSERNDLPTKQSNRRSDPKTDGEPTGESNVRGINSGNSGSDQQGNGNEGNARD